jgi:hypothetical protein
MRGKIKKKASRAAACDPPLASYDMSRATQSPLLSLVPSKVRCSRDPLRWDAGKVGGKVGSPSSPHHSLRTHRSAGFAGEVDGHSRELLFKCPSRPLFPLPRIHTANPGFSLQRDKENHLPCRLLR